MPKLLTPILLVAFFLNDPAGTTAQQAPQYSLYLLNPYAYNPACAGLENTLIATGVYRQQWSSLPGAPVSQHINAHMPLAMLSSGVGLKAENDVIGAHRTTQVALSYSFQRELGSETLLSVGASGGYLQYTLDGSKLRTPDGKYEPAGVFLHNDPLLPEGNVSASTFVAEVGVHFQWKDLAVGVAALPVFAPVLQSNSGGSFGIRPERHFILAASYRITVGRDMTVIPAFLLKSDIVETQTEVSTTVRFRENIFAGASYRGMQASQSDAAVLMGGFRLNERTSLAYSFDIPLSSLASTNRGSHELLLRYDLGKPIGTGKLPPVIYNPRFL
ncbi:MAG: type IX secretion system membrane protein PorP/SprF [Saprospiraceae bacterium]